VMGLRWVTGAGGWPALCPSPSATLDEPMKKKLSSATALAALALAVLLGPLAAFGYGPKAVVRMTDGTLRVAPASLRAALLAYEKDLRAGVEEGLAVRDSDPARAAATVVEAIPTLAAKQAPFSEIARAYGRLAGLAFQCNDPLRGQENGRLKGLSGDYYGYVERVLPRLPLTFDGYRAERDGDARAFLAGREPWLERYRKALENDYFPGGHRVSSETFDDLSNAFGTAQSVLSHAVSDAANLWLRAWESMSGDSAATPYLKRP
jgi:hypothetical protein